MKTYIKYTEDWSNIKEGIKDAQKFFGSLVDIDSSYVNFDVSSKYLYKTTNSWSWLKLVPTTSLKPEIIVALVWKPKYDCVALICDKKKASETRSLLGQHTSYKGQEVVEVYAKKRPSRQSKDTLKHELLHALFDHHNIKDITHKFLDEKKTLEDVRDYLLAIIKPAKGLQPKIKRDVAKFLEVTKKCGFDLRVVSGYRSFEEQTKLYNQGRTTKGNIVTNAKAGQSFHNYGVAFDIVDRKKGYNLTRKEWAVLAIVWHIIGGKETGWGGTWKNFVDKPHFQNTMGYSLKDFQSGNVDYKKYE